MESWDVIIVGAGSAGLAAGIYTVRSGLKTLVIDDKLGGGTIADAPTVVNYPGFAEISGGELAEKMLNHCRKLGATIHDIEPVISMEPHRRNQNCNNFQSDIPSKSRHNLPGFTLQGNRRQRRNGVQRQRGKLLRSLRRPIF